MRHLSDNDIREHFIVAAKKETAKSRILRGKKKRKGGPFFLRSRDSKKIKK